MMRVIAGTARGKNLAALPGEDVTRPTINRVKEAMFSSVQFSVPGARVLDLFAGSGQLGIEALSRGAKRCVFLDASREAIQIVLANCKTAGVFAQSRVIPDDAFHFLATTQEEFDLALLDPPYHHGTVAKALPQLAAHMAPGGVVLCETELDAELPEQLRLIAARRDVHQLAVAGVGVIRRIGISGQPGNDVILRLKEFFGFFIDLRAALPEPEDLAERAARIQNVAGHLIQALRADIAADLRILRRGS